jgi:sigma-B regulation protein RsbU (phosphoserine phosphatase)
LSEDPGSTGPDPVEDLEDLYENAPCGYLSLHTDGRIFKANATLETWIGLSRGQLVGKRFPDLLSMAGRMYYETHFAPLIALRGYFNEVALDLISASGDRVPMLVNAIAKTAPDSEHWYTRLTLFNATERRRYERNLRDAGRTSETARQDLHVLHTQAQAKLLDERETSALREQFIGVLGHDLRNPLAAISGGVEMMLRDGIAEERRAAIGHMVATSVDRMAALIDDVMDFARGRLGGGLTLDRRAGEPLEAILRQVVAELQTAAPARDIDVRITIADPVDCDRRRIAQMVSNLLANALTHGNAADPVKFEAGTADGVLRISIANTGTPIPDALVARIFEPFERGQHRASQQGLGLGLYISHQIAMAHDATLDVVSTQRETRFTFLMPLAAPS